MRLAFLPLAIPFVAALLLLFRRQDLPWQRGISATAALCTFLASAAVFHQVWTAGIIAVPMGNWPPPFGIFLTIDLLSATMLVLSSLVGMSALFYSLFDIGWERRDGSFFALYQLQIFGINGAFSTGDIFNLFVFFEVTLMTSYVLLTLGNEHEQARAGFSYFTINLIGSTIFLAGAGLLYGQLGTLNMAHLAERVSAAPNNGLIAVVAVMFLFVFGLKSAMFPVFNWLPNAYSAPPTPVSALFAGLLTKVGVYSMYRVFGTIFVTDTGFTHGTILLPAAGLTMLIGVWGAMVQNDVRYILAFHSISQVGYILLGLALYAPLAMAAGLFHMVHHSLVKSSLFLLGGGMGRAGGSQNLKKLGGLVRGAPFLALLFLVSALALAGIPPLSGFYSKFGLIAASFAGQHPVAAALALATSLFTLYSMIKIWRLGFWGTGDGKRETKSVSPGLLTACAFSVVLVVALSALAGPSMAVFSRAASQLLDRDAYIRAVFAQSPLPQPGRWEAAAAAETGGKNESR